jgi:hypothetical protein
LLPNGKVLVAGGVIWGSFGLNIPLVSAELYDPANGNWTATGPCIVARMDPTATLLANGHVLIAGGGNHLALAFSSAEEYDPISGQWSFVGNMTTNRIWHTATLLANGMVLLAGGQYFGNVLSSAELYAPGTGGVLLSSPPRLTDAKILPNGSFQFSFTNTPGSNFSILANTFPTLPASEWMVLGGAAEISPGQYQFTDVHATNYPKRFYRVRQP